MAGNLAEMLTSRGDRAIALWIADPEGPSPEQAPRLYDAVLESLVEGTDEALLRAAGLSHDTPDEDATTLLDAGIRCLPALARPVEPADAAAPLAAGDPVADALEGTRGGSQLRGVGIEVPANPEPPLLGDRRRLVLALVNLLSNAIKHAPAGSTIAITCVQDGGDVRLAVADRGP